MTNIFQNIGAVTEKALPVLVNNTIMPKLINRDYDTEFANAPHQIGDSLNIRKPAAFTVNTSSTAFSAQGFQESTTPLVLNTQAHVDVALTAKQMTLNVDNFAEQIVKPAVYSIANEIDRLILQEYKNVYAASGVAGTTPSGTSSLQTAWNILADAPAPRSKDWNAVLNSSSTTGVIQGVQTYFNPQQAISDQYTHNKLGRIADLTCYWDQNVATHTTGAYAANIGSAVTVNGAVSSGTNSIVLAGWTSGDTLKQGDVVVFTGVYGVNFMSKQSTGREQQFVVTADATANGSGAMTISVSPTPQFSGAFQNVTSSSGTIANSTVLKSVNGKTGANATATSTPQNIAFHPDAFTIAFAKLVPMNNGGVSEFTKDPKTGIGLNVTFFDDIITYQKMMRIDCLFGIATIRPELACRIMA